MRTCALSDSPASPGVQNYIVQMSLKAQKHLQKTVENISFMGGILKKHANIPHSSLCLLSLFDTFTFRTSDKMIFERNSDTEPDKILDQGKTKTKK